MARGLPSIRWNPTVRQLLFGVNAIILLLPLGLILFFHVLDTGLVRWTEQRLIAESVLIGEAWRDAYLEIKGESPATHESILPPGHSGKLFVPIEPTLDLSYGVLGPAPDALRQIAVTETAEVQAGRRIQNLMSHAKVFNLTGARVLNADGCVIASTGEDLGDCMDHLNEVQGAMRGRYASVVRDRISDQPRASFTSISRRGRLRVYTATPLFHDGRLIGIVRMSRTALSPEAALWIHGRQLTFIVGLTLLLAPIVAYTFSHWISRPLRDVTRIARSASTGETPQSFQPEGVVASEVQQLSVALEKMTGQLTERAAYIENFATTMSHELKTPITGIRGAVELLSDDWQAMSDQERNRFLHNIDVDAQRMEQLVRGLIELARIPGAHDDQVEAIEPGQALRDLCMRCNPGIEVSIDGELPTLHMNPQHFESGVRNLVDNALRHGEGKPVVVEAKQLDKKLRIRVIDQGTGVSELNRGRIFKRFFTTEREAGGTGLGLAIVQAIASTRDGSVELESREGETCFTLVL